MARLGADTGLHVSLLSERTGPTYSGGQLAKPYQSLIGTLGPLQTRLSFTRLVRYMHTTWEPEECQLLIAAVCTHECVATATTDDASL